MQQHRIIILLWLLLGRMTAASAQQIMPGGRLPAYTFTEVLNYPSTSLSTDSLKGKAILLDFWTSYCAPCIAEMPYLDSLQQEFGDRLQIITVAMELTPKVNKTVERMLSTHFLPFGRLPFPKDTTLYIKMVGPGAPLGQHAWVDPQGVVRYFSLGKQLLSRDNIRKFLSGVPLPALDSFVAAHKKENDDNQSASSQLTPNIGLLSVNGQPPIALSYLTLWKPSMGRFVPTMISARMPDTVIHAAGATLAKLYGLAYGDTVVNYPSYGFESSYGKLWLDPLIETSRRQPFGKPDSPILYYYYQSCPDTVADATRLQAVMRAQLQAAFGYHVTVQTRPMPCWKLTIADPAKINHSDKGQRPIDETDAGQISFAGYGSSFLVYQLYGGFPMEPPFIDGTGGLKDLRITLTHNENFQQLKQALLTQGLRLTLTTTPMRVIVIGD